MVLNYKNKVKNIHLWEIIVIISPFLVLIAYKGCSMLSINFCLWHLLTGNKCLGCNITHAIVSILKFDFINAFYLNPLSFVVFPLLLYVWLSYIYEHIYLNKKL